MPLKEKLKYIESQSKMRGQMDYWEQLGLDEKSTIYLINGSGWTGAATGNYLWAMTMKALGIPLPLALAGAAYNNYKNIETDNPKAEDWNHMPPLKRVKAHLFDDPEDRHAQHAAYREGK